MGYMNEDSGKGGVKQVIGLSLGGKINVRTTKGDSVSSEEGGSLQ
jgi:hypothetical protein